MRLPRIYAIFHPMRQFVSKIMVKFFNNTFRILRKVGIAIPYALIDLLNDRLIFHFQQCLDFTVHYRCACCHRPVVFYNSNASKNNDDMLYYLVVRCMGNLRKKQGCPSLDRDTGECTLKEGSCKDVEGGALNNDDARERRCFMLLHIFHAMVKLCTSNKLFIGVRSPDMDAGFTILAAIVPGVRWHVYEDHLLIRFFNFLAEKSPTFTWGLNRQ